MCAAASSPLTARHPDIQDRHVRMIQTNDFNGFFPVTCDEYLVAFLFEFLAQQAADVRTVVGNKDSCHGPP